LYFFLAKKQRRKENIVANLKTRSDGGRQTVLRLILTFLYSPSWRLSVFARNPYSREIFAATVRGTRTVILLAYFTKYFKGKLKNQQAKNPPPSDDVSLSKGLKNNCAAWLSPPKIINIKNMQYHAAG
jgi:hypothetical protein